MRAAHHDHVGAGGNDDDTLPDERGDYPPDERRPGIGKRAGFERRAQQPRVEAVLNASGYEEGCEAGRQVGGVGQAA